MKRQGSNKISYTCWSTNAAYFTTTFRKLLCLVWVMLQSLLLSIPSATAQKKIIINPSKAKSGYYLRIGNETSGVQKVKIWETVNEPSIEEIFSGIEYFLTLDEAHYATGFSALQFVYGDLYGKFDNKCVIHHIDEKTGKAYIILDKSVFPGLSPFQKIFLVAHEAGHLVSNHHMQKNPSRSILKARELEADYMAGVIIGFSERFATKNKTGWNSNYTEEMKSLYGAEACPVNTLEPAYDERLQSVQVGYKVTQSR